MMKTLVKICGITSIEDATCALQAGAAWIGLNLVGGPRRLDLPRARSILSRLDDPSRAVVLVMLDAGGLPPSLAACLRDCGVCRLQLYGEVTGQAVRTLGADGYETMVACPIAGEESLGQIGGFLTACADSPPGYLLFDTACPGRLGGTGTPADWETIARAQDAGRFDDWPPFILAGGLTSDNVAEAIHTLSPAGVDVSSGVESAPGQKDPARINAFVAAVNETATRRQ